VQIIFINTLLYGSGLSDTIEAVCDHLKCDVRVLDALWANFRITGTKIDNSPIWQICGWLFVQHHKRGLSIFQKCSYMI
jgi:hypothetical protein